MTLDPAIATYDTHSAMLCDRYDSLSTDVLFAPFAEFLPSAPARVLDVGAGSGRDAAWFLARGHSVTAAEPVAGFRDAITERAPGATCVAAQLPDLAGIAGPFDLVLANAVWHHLPPDARGAALARIAGLLAPGGRVVLSLRQGEVTRGQPVFALDPEEEIARAEQVGLLLRRRISAQSRQQDTNSAGIAWIWLVLETEMSR